MHYSSAVRAPSGHAGFAEELELSPETNATSMQCAMVRDRRWADMGPQIVGTRRIKRTMMLQSALPWRATIVQWLESVGEQVRLTISVRRYPFVGNDFHSDASPRPFDPEMEAVFSRYCFGNGIAAGASSQWLFATGGIRASSPGELPPLLPRRGRSPSSERATRRRVCSDRRRNQRGAEACTLLLSLRRRARWCASV